MQRAAHGFTYIGLLVVVVLMGVALAAVSQVWDTTSKRERERELLFVGNQFRQAIGRYYDASPGAKQFPHQLEELLEDKRFPVTKRHLRKLFFDPMTAKQEWGVLRNGEQIFGVYSLSKDKPLKIAQFQESDAAFADAASYADWKFAYNPAAAETPAMPSAPQNMPFPGQAQPPPVATSPLQTQSGQPAPLAPPGR